jgi:hypothetical protein
VKSTGRSVQGVAGRGRPAFCFPLLQSLLARSAPAPAIVCICVWLRGRSNRRGASVRARTLASRASVWRAPVWLRRVGWPCCCLVRWIVWRYGWLLILFCTESWVFMLIQVHTPAAATVAGPHPVAFATSPTTSPLPWWWIGSGWYVKCIHELCNLLWVSHYIYII